MLKYFSQYVQVKEALVVCDAATQKHCGFGFLTLNNEEDMSFVISTRHRLKGAYLDCKIALDRYQAKEKESEELTRKLFVGSIPRSTTDQCLFDYFTKFGLVEKAYIVKHS